MQKKNEVIVIVLVFFLAGIIQFQSEHAAQFRLAMIRVVGNLYQNFEKYIFLQKMKPLKEINSIDVLSEYVNDFDKRLREEASTYGYVANLSHRLDAIEHQLNFSQRILLDDFRSADMRKGVFMSTQDRKSVEDSSLSNMGGEWNLNFGADELLHIGLSDEAKEKYRIIIRFNEISEKVPKEAKLVNAIFYMKQTPDIKVLSSEGVALEVFAVRQMWQQGEQSAHLAKKGEVTWEYVRFGEQKWNTPGAWLNLQDVEDRMMAFSVNIGEVQRDQWIPFYFTEYGLSLLQRTITGDAPNYGWLIMITPDARGSMVSFHSAESEEVKSRPYLEIYYYY